MFLTTFNQKIKKLILLPLSTIVKKPEKSLNLIKA